MDANRFSTETDQLTENLDRNRLLILLVKLFKFIKL